MNDGITGDQITILNDFSGLPHVQTIAFSDGSTLNISQGIAITATGSTLQSPYGGKNTLIATPGNEVLYGNSSPNTFIGSVGTETLFGSSGAASTFVIGKGLTSIIGEGNGDVYSYGAGDGTLFVNEIGFGVSFYMGAGVNASQISFTASGHDLLVADGVAGDQIRFENQLTSASPIQKITFADHSTFDLVSLSLAIGPGATALYGTSGSDTLTATAGTETLIGNGGNDTFVAAAGAETLVGGYGNDTYSYLAGDGQVTITDSGGVNTIDLGGTLRPSDMTIARSGFDMVITDNVSGDQLTIQNQYNDSPLFVASTLVFSDGSTMSLTGGQLITAVGNGSFAGTAGDDTLIGGTGIETLDGNGGHDTLVGGTGTQTLFARGNSTYIAGKGSEFLEGYGNDVYSYASGDGAVTISDSGGTNRLVLGAGLNLASVTFSRLGTNDLLLTDGIAGDSIDIQSQLYSGQNPVIATLVFGDGSTFNLANGLPIFAHGNGFFAGASGNDTLTGGSGTETLAGNGGNDTFIAGTGTETLQGGFGNDTYSYAGGDGNVTISDGGGTNTLALAANINRSNVTVSVSGNDIVITDGVAGDQIRLSNQLFTSSGVEPNAVQTLRFSDGSTMSLTGFTVSPTTNGVINGTPGNDTLIAASGTETLNGNGGSDTFIGASGTECLYGNAGNGNNLFVMGQGVATAFGGSGNDVYSYATGGGSFVLNDGGGTNALKLGQGISSAQVTLTASGTDLLIGDGTAGDQIRLVGQLSSSNKIQTLVCGDGSTMSIEGVALTGTCQ